ncbi:MAG: HXXEE domain-containing protein, partial [Pseudomonadota bacterium]
VCGLEAQVTRNRFGPEKYIHGSRTMNSKNRQEPAAHATVFVLLVVFFLMLWLPLGQQDFLTEHWMKVGAYLAPLVLMFLLLGRANAKGRWFRDLRLLAGILTSAYLIHQIEEHWIDLLGRAYPLHGLLNDMLRERIGESAYGAMTPATIFFVNTSLVWLPGLISILRAPRDIFPTLAMAGLVLVNGVVHLAQGMLTWSYNPGLLTAVMLSVPISIAAYLFLIKLPAVRYSHVVASIAWGVGAHVLLVAGLIASRVYDITPVGLYYSLLVGWAIVPLFAFQNLDIEVDPEPTQPAI